MRSILVLLLFPFYCFAQEIRLDSIMTANTAVRYTSIKEQIKEASDYYSCDNLRGNAICFGNLKSALQSDVFEYYDLDEKYASDLQKENFKQTQDYKDKLNALISVRNGFLNMPLYVELNKSEDFKISDYDLKEGGFNITTGIKLIPSEFTIYNKYYDLKPVPTKTSISAYYHPSINPQKLFDRYFFFKTSKAIATQIEEQKDNVKCLIIFKPQGISKRDNGFLGYDYFASTDLVRFLIINQSTDEVYFDKLFSIVKKSVTTKKK